MGRKKKKEDPPGPKGAPDWVVTFTDMISLLVTFFVLLMTFSSLDVHEAMKVDSFLTGQRGVHSAKASSMPDLGEEDIVAATSVERGASTPHSRPPDELGESLEEMGQNRSDAHRELELNNVADGIVIDFGTDETFNPGSTEIPESLRISLGEIGRVLEHYPHMVVVEGFTDGEFKATPQYASADALSLARAHAAAKVILNESGLSRELVQLVGQGDRHPVADNVSPGGRRENRRVRLRILALSKMRATYLESQRAKQKGL